MVELLNNKFYPHTKMKKQNKFTKTKTVNTIRNLQVTEKKGEIVEISFSFGPHFGVVVTTGRNASITLVATHHGVKLSAAELNDELEVAIGKLRKSFPFNVVD